MGVKVTDVITPTDPSDTYATHDSSYGKGGHREVATHAERDAIPAERRREGMTVYTAEDKAMWQLDSDLTTWLSIGSSWNEVSW